MLELLRLASVVSGEVPVTISILPRPGYGRIRPTLRERASLGWFCTWANEALVIRSDVPLRRDDALLHASVRMQEGMRFCLSVSYTAADAVVLPLLGSNAEERVDGTAEWWREWLSCCTYDGPYRDAIERSVITLRLLAYALSGAVVAAPTTSLPESIGHDRNWDYRYCWLRDAGLTVQALLGIGFKTEARAYLDWLLHATRLTWPELRVVYDLFGRACLPECELPEFRGFADSRPVRIGNAASTQKQLDIYGDVVLAAGAVVAAGGRLDATERRMLIGLGRTVCRIWREPDSGIWEVRGPPRHYTYSKVMAWAALDRLLRLAACGALSLGRHAAKFRQERDAIAELLDARAFNPALDSYTAELGGAQVGAALLQIPLLGFKSPGDPRVRGTLSLIEARLTQNALVYRTERGFDRMDSPEGTFGICSFWRAELLARQGEHARAMDAFEQLLTCANDLGLFAEEIDAATGAALGNFPQAFTHVGLINAALAIQGRGRVELAA
jgi:GH15 family glucan-1,4-alpha-glucosidase